MALAYHCTVLEIWQQHGYDCLSAMCRRTQAAVLAMSTRDTAHALFEFFAMSLILFICSFG